MKAKQTLAVSSLAVVAFFALFAVSAEPQAVLNVRQPGGLDLDLEGDAFDLAVDAEDDFIDESDEPDVTEAEPAVEEEEPAVEEEEPAVEEEEPAKEQVAVPAE